MATEKNTRRLLLLLLHLYMAASSSLSSPVGGAAISGSGDERAVIEVDGKPDSVVWVVQLSDLHFSVHHPERAYDFRRYVGPALAMVNPSLVLITGDLTDGKSKDLLTMKQNEVEWIEYEEAISDVVKSSGLPRKIFHDLKGNHDNFGVPKVGGEYDFYHNYSVNGKFGRKGHIQSVTLENDGWKHLFIGFDSTMDIGLRGPTNLFGHPTDELLMVVDQALSQWDTEFTTSPVTKIAFGHFPLSFSTLTESGRSLKDVFLKHSLATYLCGHLHARFGKNLKRHYSKRGEHARFSDHYYQFKMHQGTASPVVGDNCSRKAETIEEFWEWEMGDWRKSRIMRILAIDSGHVSYTDIDFRLGSKSIIIVPTFPVDSRFMQRMSSPHEFNCHKKGTSSFEAVRTLIFSRNGIRSVVAKVYDSRYGAFNLVLESEMKLVIGKHTRGDMYVAPWNWRAFADSTPDRYWLQIEATDISGDTSYSQLRPFSINGLTTEVSWTWKEFFVMGCQWASIYYPALWSVIILIFMLLLIPKASFELFEKHFTVKRLGPNSSPKTLLENPVSGTFCLFTELSRLTLVWSGLLVYMIYLLFFPWFFGHAITEKSDIMHMTYAGWSVKSSHSSGKVSQIGTPDVMVIVLPHLCFAVLPTLLILAGIAAERTAYGAYYRSVSGKKQDDRKGRRHTERARIWNGRWIRKFLLLLCLVVFWRHLKNCRAVVKAYDMNPLVHSPVYCFSIPLLIALAIYKTSSI